MIPYKKPLFAALALVAAANFAFAQTPKKPQVSPKERPMLAAQIKGEAIPIDPAVKIGKLPNGLTYYIRKNVEPKNRAVLYLVNKAGSVLESDDQQGLAHFTEHMAFNGTRDFPKNKLIDYLQKSGVKFGADLNAYTSFDETVYQLPLPTDSAKVLEKGIAILANWAGYITFDTDEINSERGVILEEDRQRGKNAQQRLQQQWLPVVMNNSRYSQRLPIGKTEILKNFKPETIKSFYHDWYRPDLQAVVAVGDFDPAKIEELIKQDFSALKNPAKERPRTKYSVPYAAGTKVKIATDKEFPYTMAQIFIKHPSVDDNTTSGYLRDMRTQLFNQMLNARISELTQKADPPFLFGQVNYGNFIGKQDALTEVAVAKTADQLKLAIDAVLAETERARKFGFTESEFARAKQATMTAMENSYKERDKTRSDRFVGEYQRNFLDNEPIPGIEWEYKFYQDNLDKIKLSDINALAGQFISDQNRDVVILAPEKEKSKLPSESTLLGWINSAGKGVSAYVDNVSKEPLLATPPTGSKITAEQKNANLGTTTLTLANGVKVILKPTDFKNDQILIRGYSFGGTSLAPDADFISDNMADNIVSSSGIGKFTQIQLDKMMTGKNVSISPYINETTEGIGGSASPKDFETALQLIYLYFTQPRKDADIWQSNITQTRSMLANRSLDPQSVFADTVAATLGNHNPRRMPLTLAQLNSANLDKAYAFYKDRFADASDFTFTLVGSFSVDEVKPLLEKYLGGLPSTGRKESYKDLGIRAPKGQITKTVYKGIGDKSIVQLVFSGDYDYNEANNLQLEGLQEVLNIKMIERLREKEGGVYSPSIRSAYSKIPVGRYNITISFSCAPANVDKLINAALDEINKIKQNGAEKDDIEKFVAEEKRQVEVQLKENGFWASYLSSSDETKSDPERILTYIDKLNQVTVPSTKEAANKYLSGTNLIKLILYPEKNSQATK
ncbi:insulinase family protein [Mucilaginibacter sp. RS28]|uniref:Insulinase family protein n=1 Tax=Mucilaginibacter straminoryzae TaxID=2932774 RepID=A0A9X1X555_9SPHI|nr:M16 family metallopeptidase [Mucilaginibacter straminoryzae]MCJ8210605.1 insulinase family protein [Mucilaginibacter straminoryzae]